MDVGNSVELIAVEYNGGLDDPADDDFKGQKSRRRCAWRVLALTLSLLTAVAVAGFGEDDGPPRAFIDGTGPGWKALGEDDFVDVNGDPDTWTWKDGVLHCTGQAGRRDPHDASRTRTSSSWPSGGTSARAGTRASSSGRPRRRCKDLKPGTLPARRDRGAGPRPRLRRAVREADRQEGRLVHDPRRRLRRRARRR